MKINFDLDPSLLGSHASGNPIIALFGEEKADRLLTITANILKAVEKYEEKAQEKFLLSEDQHARIDLSVPLLKAINDENIQDGYEPIAILMACSFIAGEKRGSEKASFLLQMMSGMRGIH